MKRSVYLILWVLGCLSTIPMVALEEADVLPAKAYWANQIKNTSGMESRASFLAYKAWFDEFIKNNSEARKLYEDGATIQEIEYFVETSQENTANVGTDGLVSGEVIELGEGE